jgi:hypothetical protein
MPARRATATSARSGGWWRNVKLRAEQTAAAQLHARGIDALIVPGHDMANWETLAESYD